MLAALIAFALVVLVGYIGGVTGGLHPVFGVAIPYLAFFLFVFGVAFRVYKWASSPVPFRIPTTTGQQKSLDWIPQDRYENPDTKGRVFVRMLLEVLFFRSLFRNTKAEVRGGPKVAYGSSKWLWVGAMAFHWSFLIIILRHFRFFAEPTPAFAYLLGQVDGFMEIGIPTIYITNLLILAALSYLFLRRLFNPQVRFFSLPQDYFPLLLIGGIALTGMGMRYLEVFRVDVVAVKELAAGLVAFNPTVPDGIGAMFYVHLFMVSTLLIYFPFSKLVHLGGVFLSPTRNMANNNRRVRHVNPWNPKVEVHEYHEWEDEYRQKIEAAGLPLEKSEPAKEEA